MAIKRVKPISWFCLVALVAIIGCKKEPKSNPAEPNNPSETAQQQTTPAADDSRPALRDIIARARGWGPTLTNWYGKQAPDFTVTDITGKKHTLSEYRGKNVMLIFWATWCPPCIMEIPHLVELRNTIGEDKLAMLAISYIDFRNKPETVKKFVAAKPIINYTVTATDIDVMPRPYNLVNSIPSSFFIDPEGKIKIATEGLIPLSDTKAIIEAER
ncbi:MAG: TlpA disulfide reductase family protein [Planctomycetota bacterium]